MTAAAAGALPPWPPPSTFVAARAALAVAPGPGVLFSVGRSLARGRRCGLVSVAAIAVGNLANALGPPPGLPSRLPFPRRPSRRCGLQGRCT